MNKEWIAPAGAAVALLLASASSEAQSLPISCGGALSFPGGASACRDYVGSAWTPQNASADCTSIPGASGGQLIVGTSCDTTSVVGVCRVDQGAPTETALLFYAGDLSALQNACEGFLQGTWSSTLPAGRCDHFAATAPGAPGIPACKEYTGSDWNASLGESDCAALDQSNFTADASCGASAIGYCTFAGDTSGEYSIHYYAGDAASLAAGCEGFGHGVWTDAQAPDDRLLDEAYAALNSDATVTVSPNACDQACLDQLIATKGAITFTPTGAAPTDGFIYLPGGTVDPRAYAVAARQIAAAGYFVAIIPFPGGIAIADPFRPNAVIAAHPEIEHWAIGGHSLGGVTASLYADVDPLDKIEALAIYAAYPPLDNDLSDDANLRVYSLLGTEDANMDMVEWNEAKQRLPAHTYYGILKGANHEQFGYYTGQLNDGEPLISRKQQHDLYVGATIHMLRHLGLPACESYVSSIYSELRPLPQQACGRAQVAVGGFKPKDLSYADINVIEYDAMVPFRGDHPGFSSDGEHLIDVISYTAQTSNPDDITAPPIFDGEIWCKMKSQEAIASQFNFKVKHAQAACADANREIFDWALRQVPACTRSAYQRSHMSLTYGADIATMSGPEFIDSQILLSQTGPHAETLRAPQLNAPLIVPAPFGGTFYCKLWSPEAAVKFIKQAAGGF